MEFVKFHEKKTSIIVKKSPIAAGKKWVDVNKAVSMTFLRKRCMSRYNFIVGVTLDFNGVHFCSQFFEFI